jgi:Family of unknown function (DUF6502)
MRRAIPDHPLSVAQAVFRPLVRLLKASGIRDLTILAAVGLTCKKYANEPVTGCWLDGARFSQLSEILSVWMQDPDFSDENGEPCKLNLGRKSPCLSDVLRKSGVLAHPDQTLEELRELGAVQVCGRNRLRLVSNVLFSVRGKNFLAVPSFNAIRRLAETIEHNVLDSPGALEGLMQRSAYCLSLDQRQFNEVQRFVRLGGQTFLDAVDEKLRVSVTHEKRRAGPRYGVGVYVFVDPPARLGHRHRDRRARAASQRSVSAARVRNRRPG